MRPALILLALFIGSVQAPANAQVVEPPFKASGAFLGLSVPDVSASARWYQEKLGLRVVMQPPKAGEVAVVILEGGGLLVELIQHDKARPLGVTVPLGHGYFKAGLIVDDFEGTIAAIRARGIPIAFGPYPKTASQRANAIISDNAGNLIQFLGK